MTYPVFKIETYPGNSKKLTAYFQNKTVSIIIVAGIIMSYEVKPPITLTTLAIMDIDDNCISETSSQEFIQTGVLPLIEDINNLLNELA